MRHFTPQRVFLFCAFFLLVSVTVFSFAFPGLTFAQQDPKLQVPDTIEGAKEGVLNIGDKIIAAIPQAIAGIWNNQVIPAWKKMGVWIKTEIWEKRVLPAFQTIVDRAKEFLGREVEKRKPIVEQELEKEKQELRDDLQKAGKTSGKGLWERFKALFQGEEQ